MKGIALLLVMSVLLFGTVIPGCKGAEEKAPAAKEIVEAAIEAVTQLNTYRFRTADYMDMVTEGTGQTGVWKIEIEGAVDEAGRKMLKSIQFNFKEQGATSRSSMDIYLVGGWAYIKSDDNSWDRSQSSEDYWEQQDAMSQQLGLLTKLAPVELLGTETVNGVESYKLQLKPEKRAVWSWIVSQGWSQILEGHKQEFTADIVSDYLILQWVAKDTHFLVKSAMEITMRIDADTIVYSTTVLMQDFNMSVTIELPPGAKQ